MIAQANLYNVRIKMCNIKAFSSTSGAYGETSLWVPLDNFLNAYRFCEECQS